jgi:hypothetical protein
MLVILFVIVFSFFIGKSSNEQPAYLVLQSSM